jgi:Bax protein
MKKSQLDLVHRLTSFLFLLLVLTTCERSKIVRVKAETIKVDSLEQIVLVTDPKVRPLLYTNVSGFDKLPVREAKAKFLSAILPSILVAKHEIAQQRKAVELLSKKAEWKFTDSVFYLETKNRYKAENLEDLMIRMVTLPTSIVLAQAAVESGWGKSRIFLKANNLFGVWSYNSLEPRIPALYKRAEKRTYLRSYADMSQSVIHYFEILARSRSYKTLREARLQTDDPFELLPHLKNFSERRTLYTNQLKRVIVKNNLTMYDQYQIDPAFLVED